MLLTEPEAAAYWAKCQMQIRLRVIMCLLRLARSTGTTAAAFAAGAGAEVLQITCTDTLLLTLHGQYPFCTHTCLFMVCCLCSCILVLLWQALVALEAFKVPRMDMWRRELYAAAGYKLFRYPNWRQRVKVLPAADAPAPFSRPYRRKWFGRRSSSSSSSSMQGSPAGAAGRVLVGRGPDGALRGKGGVGGVPVALRSGDWGVLDGLGGGRGVLGSMGGSYEELGSSSSGSGSPGSVDGATAPVAGSAAAAVALAAAAAAAENAAVRSASSSASSTWGSLDEPSSSMDVAAATSAGTAATAAPAAGQPRATATAAAPKTPAQGWNRSADPRPLKAAGLVRPAKPPQPSAAAPGPAAARADGVQASAQGLAGANGVGGAPTADV
jgi:hypothetical protein